MDEKVDILLPPNFSHTGEVKLRSQAYKDGNWLGTFNLWVVTGVPEPSIIYQLRGPGRSWAPNKLDVAAGGHYLAGEKLIDGLREVEEELGKKYDPKQLIFLGRKIYVGFQTDGTSKNNIIDIYLTEDNETLSNFVLQKDEVFAICRCPIIELLNAHRNPNYEFQVEALTADRQSIELKVSKESFPENFDNYHYKMAVIANRYFRGDTDLLY